MGTVIKNTSMVVKKIEAHSADVDQTQRKKNKGDDVVFTGHFTEFFDALFQKVESSEPGRGCDCRYKIIEVEFKDYFVPTENKCFANCARVVTAEQ